MSRVATQEKGKSDRLPPTQHHLIVRCDNQDRSTETPGPARDWEKSNHSTHLSRRRTADCLLHWARNEKYVQLTVPLGTGT